MAPIRAQHLDLSRASTNRETQSTFIGDVSAAITRAVFVAPYDCVIRRIYVLKQDADVFNSSQSRTFTVAFNNASGTVIGRHNTAMSASALNEITASSNNSLTTGQSLVIQTSQTCQTMCAAVIYFEYEPLKHKASL